ncbi:MAG: hypothetical protein EOO55_02005 [Hymenobacter sp.]|nr:MAG: hypothetical protein EOO55_02005 [Hymenobacter sp.]
MPAKRLYNITAGKLISANVISIVVFMITNSVICPESYTGGECVKDLDNRVFFYQILLNILFACIYLTTIKNSKWLAFIINLIATAIFYVVAATFHSISKAGIF